MKDKIFLPLHCYNHFAMDIVNDIANITDAAHKYKTVVLDTLSEPFDIRQIAWKGNTKLLDVLKILCDKNGWPYEKFHIVSWNPAQPKSTWPSMKKRWQSLSFTYVAGKKISIGKHIKKHFGLYINNSSWPRLWLSAFLLRDHRHKTDQTFVRSPTNPSHMANLDVDAMLFYFSSGKFDKHIDLKSVQNLLEASPITASKIDINDNADEHFNTEHEYSSVYSPVADDIMDRYNNIFCDVICETMFTGECFSLDEKMARCFVTETPFICMANKNYLEKIRLLGFKTFNAYWDESYDCTSDASRCIEMAKVIDKLAGLDVLELKYLYQKLQPVLKHNKERYFELCGMPKDKLEKIVLSINQGND